MKKWLLVILMLSTLGWSQSIMQDQNTKTWGKNGQATGTTANFPDLKGTVTEKFEVLVNGTAPASLTVTVVGCMRGGTCSSTIATSSGTASQLLTPSSSDIFDFYQVTTSWTGGDATTQFVINRTGTVARKGGGTATVASGTAALGTGAITNGTCATVVTVAATGTLTTDVIAVDFNADPSGVTGYNPTAGAQALTIFKYPTANNVNFKVCNFTAGSITPGAITLNWRVVR